MFVFQNNGPASHPCTRNLGDDRLAVRAGVPAGCSVSGADPRRIAPWTMITVETCDGPRLENRVPTDVRPAEGAKTSSSTVSGFACNSSSDK